MDAHPPPPPPSGPAAPPSPPLGTMRPKLSTIEEIREVEGQFAASRDGTGATTPAPAPEVSREVMMRKIGRLEGAVSLLLQAQTEASVEQKRNTKITSKGTYAAQAAALLAAAAPVFMLVCRILGQWGDAHPEAQYGISGLVLLAAKVIAQGMSGRASVASSGHETPAGPPPGST